MQNKPGNHDESPVRSTGIGPAELFAGPGETLERLRSTNWAETALGPVTQWPDALVTAARLAIPSRMPLLIWWGPNLIQIYNEAYAQLVGTKHPEAIAMPAKRCWDEVWDELSPLATQVMNDGQATFAENMLLLLERHDYVEETYWTFSFSPITDASGEVAGIFVVTTDVTAQVVGARRLETVRQLGTVSVANAGGVEEICKAAVDVLSANRQAVPFAAVYVIDPEQADATAHARLVASYGVAQGTSVTPTQRFVLDDNPTLAKAVASGARGLITGLRETIPREAFDRGPLGDQTPDAAMVLPVSVSAQSRPAAVAVLGVNAYRAVDEVYLTFFHLVARQLRVALGDALAYESERLRTIALIELDEDKTRFYQNVSHEFRTPLTLILGPLRTILDEGDQGLSPRHRETLLSARRAALRLRKLVDSLLEFARAEADEVHATPEPTDLAALTADLASMFRSVVEQAGLEYIVDIAESGDPVDIDRDMWAKIVLNLLSNAVKFTSQGSIRVELRQSSDDIELRVCDTGIGIPAAHLSTVFDRFAQVPDQRGRSAEGTGIGLALVAALAAANGGEVSVESVPKQGTTFTVSLPRVASAQSSPAEPVDRTGDSAIDAYLVEAESWLRAGPSVDSRPAAESIGRLLLVEDNADMRDYLLRLLTEDGWTVDAVGSVDAAVKVNPAPDVVVSDIMLPGRSGVDLVRMLRSDPSSRRIPIILLTARTGPESAAAGLASGADDYIAKPFDPAELLARIRVHHDLMQLRELELSQAENKAANLQRALASNRQIGVAMGVLMAGGKLTEEQAFDRMREVSQRRNRKLRDIADEIVLTGALPIDNSHHAREA